ncbi:hypothetical protein CCYA_CCYA08G2343 [Cyanidiococcus yangmingshanensis]|nr:hypothetical protein CCYA_CCYA08G2343 [Cyanidiococcus yangmingshanensis]
MGMHIAFAEFPPLLFPARGLRAMNRRQMAARQLEAEKERLKLTTGLVTGGSEYLSDGRRPRSVSCSYRLGCYPQRVHRNHGSSVSALKGMRAQGHRQTRPSRTFRAAAKDALEVYREFKPMWCQPWSIVATGLTIIVVSWVWLPFRPYLATAISGCALFWWYLFLWEYPRMVKEDLPTKRPRTQRSRAQNPKKL